MTTTTSGRSRGEESEIRIKGTKRNKEIFHVIFGESRNLANGGAAEMDLALVDKCVFLQNDEQCFRGIQEISKRRTPGCVKMR